VIGKTLAHFKILSNLGKGGMGEVYRALDTKLKREVAIKILPPEMVSDAERLERFELEAQTIASLNHPNIVTIYSIEEAEGRSFITMELVRGETLARLIPEDGFEIEKFFEYAIPLTSAVSAAHERGVTHRDLKPANIMVSDDGRLKILDFGLAKPPEPDALSEVGELPTQPNTMTALIWGTLPYMSPEQLQGRVLTHHSDIFSLGVILYEMSTGHRPFGGDTSADFIASILRDIPESVNTLKSGLSRRLGKIIGNCLEKESRQRPQTALEIKTSLQAARTDSGTAREEILPSIAVLPFADMSREKDQDYFCEGIAEEIINALSQVKSLHVLSRISAFKFKATELDSREKGRQLGVNSLLEGSVRKAGTQLRITAQLIDVNDGYNLWSERFDRELKDVFAIQDEIARSIAQTLKITLSPKESSALGRVPTMDPKAYDYYLRGKQYYYIYDRRGVEFALRMFTQAIELDPTYARAYAGIADCCSYLFTYAGNSEAHLEKADTASQKALELEPESAEAHASRGVALSLKDQYAEAESAFETAIRLDPKLFEAHYFYARVSFVRGELGKALELYEKAGQVQPDDYQAPLLVAQVYSSLGRESDAENARRRGVRIAESRLSLNPDDVRALYMGANGLVALGETKRGLEWARQALEMDPDDPMVLYNVACIQSLAGSAEESLDSLEMAVKAGLTQREWIENDSNLDPLRNHPRYLDLMKLLDS